MFIYVLMQIIVATPGRLLDHVENKSGFSVRLMGLKMLILDEADHLLDLGFRKDIEKIVDCLPRQRHSLLFSATVPKEVNPFSCHFFEPREIVILCSAHPLFLLGCMLLLYGQLLLRTLNIGLFRIVILKCMWN